MADARLCRDCRHVIPGGILEWLWNPSGRWRHARCGHKVATSQGSASPVTGKVPPVERLPCSVMRADFRLCRPKGVLWEPKS